MEYTAEQIREMLKLMPLDVAVTIEDLKEIFKNEL